MVAFESADEFPALHTLRKTIAFPSPSAVLCFRVINVYYRCGCHISKRVKDSTAKVHGKRAIVLGPHAIEQENEEGYVQMLDVYPTWFRRIN